MTYQDLLAKTEQRKREAIQQINAAMSGKAGFLCRAELERNPGAVAWLWLAKGFCEELAEHIGEWVSNDPWDMESREIADIYMAYEDGAADLYDYLPVEAQLFAEE